MKHEHEHEHGQGNREPKKKPHVAPSSQKIFKFYLVCGVACSLNFFLGRKCCKVFFSFSNLSTSLPSHQLSRVYLT